MDIRWLDGNTADGMYILEIHFSSGTTGYMKNKTREGIAHYYEILYKMPEVTGFLVYNPQGEQIFNNIRTTAA